MNFGNSKIGTRLAGSFAILLLVMLGVIATASVNFSRLGRADAINTHTYEVLNHGNALLLTMVNLETGMRGFVAGGQERFLEPYTAGSKEFGNLVSSAMDLTADNAAQQTRLRAMQASETEFVKVAESLIQMRRDVAKQSKTSDELLAAFAEGKDKQAMDRFRAINAEFLQAETALLGQRSQDAADLRALTQSVMIGGGIVALLFGIAVAMLLTRSIVRPLDQAVAVATAVSGGDLTQSIEGSGRSETALLLTALRTMQDSLVRVVSGVRTNSESLAVASAQIEQGNQDLSSRTEQQASALEETAASMEQLGATVRQNADNAREANELAMKASSVAVSGGEVVGRVVETMKGINDSSRKIADIISVIDSIAFQTNILALNAAVEAARAGEQGRGFAVVASEVRSLAQRSADAAKEIKSLIMASVERVEQGTMLVDQAGTTMQDVVGSIRRVTDIMAEISAASVEQSAGVAQVGEAVTQMDQATQQNAALVEQSAAAASSLKAQADQLVQAVAVFQLSTTTRHPALAAVPARDRLALRQVR